MKKIYKVVIRYNYMTDRGIRWNTNFEFFNSRKAYQNYINELEMGKFFENNYDAYAEVYAMELDYRGRFWDSHKPIDNFTFSTNKKAMFV